MSHKILLHDSFLKGNLNTKENKDWPHLNETERTCISEFISNYTNKKENCGTNKKNYHCYDYWHYHIGYPNYDTPFCKRVRHAECYNLTQNPKGKESAGILHYIKYPDRIEIIGYSPTHIPFPDVTKLKTLFTGRFNT